MPYEIKHEGDEWCIYNKDTGESKGCSDSEAMAKRHLAALYVHEKKGALALSMTITEVKKSNGRIRWRGRLNTGQVDTQNERFDKSFFDDLVQNFWAVQEKVSKGEALPDGMNAPQLDVAHLSFYYELIDKSLRVKARAGWLTRLWTDGDALMADGYYDDSPLGKASAKAGLRDDKTRPRLSIAVYPDFENVVVDKSGVLTYEGGRGKAWLDHVAQTMHPVNAGTDIRAEVDMELKATTVLDDAQAVLQDDELTKKLGEPLKTKSEVVVPDGALVKAKEKTVSEAIVTTPPVVEAVAPVAPEKPIEAIKSEVEVVDLKPINDKIDALAVAMSELIKALPGAMQNAASEAVKPVLADIEALKKSDGEKVKSAIDHSGDWLFNLYNPRKAADNVASADEVKKAAPTETKSLEGIWAAIAPQTPGG